MRIPKTKFFLEKDMERTLRKAARLFLVLVTLLTMATPVMAKQ